MENQHRKIKGYRELSAEEISLMNLLKSEGEEFNDILSNLKFITINPVDESLITAEQRNERLRCIALAKTQMQQGLMWAVRAVALPDSF